MDVNSWEFHAYLACGSILAALAAQMREVNGKRPKWLRIACQTFFYALTGYAAGLLISRYVKDAVAVIGAVMAIGLLKLTAEQVFSPAMLWRIGVRRDKENK